jgi:pyruvate formate lyase activating enzyme
MKEAMLYETTDDGRVKCSLCAHRCLISPSRKGICGVRENKDGILYSLVYGMIIAENIDPIEKKPLFHIFPGSKSYSIATAGCNFRCTFCQNHEISQMPSESGIISGRQTSAPEIIQRAVSSGSKTIAYTYTEPTIYFEYALDVAKLAREHEIKNIFVTNGFMTKESLETVAPYLDGANVDLKSFSDEFYKKHCGARLQPVLDTLKRMKDLGIWVEITTLLIPGLNESEDELQGIVNFIHAIGPETPWHISRFHPRYKMNNMKPTSLDAIRRAMEIGKAGGLKYVYSGNVPGDGGEDTLCSKCGETLIQRYGFLVESIKLQGSSCLKCKTTLDGIF